MACTSGGWTAYDSAMRQRSIGCAELHPSQRMLRQYIHTRCNIFQLLSPQPAKMQVIEHRYNARRSECAAKYMQQDLLQ